MREPQFETRRHDAIRALEAHLIAHPGDDPDGWLRLARIRRAQGREGEALEALERAVWTSDADATAAAVIEEIGPPMPEQVAPASARAELTIGLFGEVLALLGDPAPDPAACRSLGGMLRLAEARLRQRTRWILWRLLLARAPDAGEVARVRAALLAELHPEVPSFVRAQLVDDAEAQRAWEAADLAALRAQIE